MNDDDFRTCPRLKMKQPAPDAHPHFAISGREVTTAANGPEALQRLGNSKYDLVYLDIHLPRWTACKVLREIQKFGPDHAGRALHGTRVTGNRGRSHAAGRATDYLLKPLQSRGVALADWSLLKRQSLSSAVAASSTARSRTCKMNCAVSRATPASSPTRSCRCQ